MTEQIMNILVCFYFFLEIYIFVYSQELRIRNHYEYYEKLAQINCIIPEEPIIHSLPTEVTDIPLYKESPATYSELDEAARELFSELQQELGMVELPDNKEENNETIYTDPDHFEQDGELNEFSDGYISLSDLEENVQYKPTGYEAYASAKIADELNGPQQWVVAVVGMEDQYIHVSDGKRLWVNVGEKAAKLNKGDVLILNIIRNGKEIQVENLIRIESAVNEDRKSVV